MESVTVTEVAGKVILDPAPSPSGKPSKTWEFTINNYNDADIEWINRLDVKRIIASYEVGESGTPHIQGKVTFARAYRLAQLKKLNPRAHFEVSKLDQDYNYAKKADSVILRDDNFCRQGERTDLRKLRDDVVNGRPVDDIAVNDPYAYHAYGRTLNKIEDVCSRKSIRVEMTKGRWYFGPTGSGKSHTVFENFSPETHFVWKNDKGWWDGYTQQPTVIINDFRGEIEFNLLLQIVDKWPFSVPRRGREPIPFTSGLVLVTSSLPPHKIYRELGGDDIRQLWRRFEIIRIGKDREQTRVDYLEE